MIHRHLEIGPDVTVENLPLAALTDLLSRGDLHDWRPIVDAIAIDPHGEFAAKVLRLVDAYPIYGTSPLFRAWIDRRRARLEGSDTTAAPMSLATLRRKLGLTQVELAERIGMTQSDLSKLERRKDVRISTLSELAGAVGGRLRIILELGGERTEGRRGARFELQLR